MLRPRGVAYDGVMRKRHGEPYPSGPSLIVTYKLKNLLAHRCISHQQPLISRVSSLIIFTIQIIISTIHQHQELNHSYFQKASTMAIARPISSIMKPSSRTAATSSAPANSLTSESAAQPQSPSENPAENPNAEETPSKDLPIVWVSSASKPATDIPSKVRESGIAESL